nr:MAG TPA: hypothetical protein [Caudoviricetes sp.]
MCVKYASRAINTISSGVLHLKLLVRKNFVSRVASLYVPKVVSSIIICA